MESRGGIWIDKPRVRRGDRGFGVVGMAWSSLLCKEILSRKVGDGASVLGVLVLLTVGGSEKERDFVGVLEGDAFCGRKGSEGSILPVMVSIVQFGSVNFDRSAGDVSCCYIVEDVVCVGLRS